MSNEKNIDTSKEKTVSIITEDPVYDDKFLPLLPLKNVIILPKSILPVIVGRSQSIQAVEYALRTTKTLFISTQIDAKTEGPTASDVFAYGVKATILQVIRMPNGALKILVEGLSRARIVRSTQTDSFISIFYEDVEVQHPKLDVELEALWRGLKELYERYAKLNEKTPADLMSLAKTTDDMDTVADTLAVHINLSFTDRQSILETPNLKERIVTLCAFLSKELEILETEQRIKNRIQTQVEKGQREYYLSEQMKAIQKELGREDIQDEVDKLRKQAKRAHLSKEAHEKVQKELKRLEQMPPLSSEAVVSRNYIDWILALPWNKTTTDTISLQRAEKMLDENHAGLKKAKERIIEFLAAKKFSKSIKRSPIICLVGPPGVGKTSLAKSISQSMGREFIRISLGGIKDESEIRGHRRTYIGAMPGKIIQAMRKTKTINPVILLDEIDKLSRDIHGDPASALLEVLDPEQNHAFLDHFIEVGYDLSKIIFIATANMIDSIPYPLFDRMEIINLSGYTEEEKVEIARSFLIPKNLEEYDLTKKQFKISDAILHNVISQYTREAGVRQLERIIAKLMRKAIQVFLKNKKKISHTITVNEKYIKLWLGNPKFKKTSLDQEKNRIGLATGLAWTEFGGDMLEIEVTVIQGKGSLQLTGQLGEVMQESAQAALSYIRSRAQNLGLRSSFTSTKDIHIHIPEGATPKDGPSAGITMCVALVSALTKNPTKPVIAMTGEITLRGRVIAVGGLKEKILAARQQGFKLVLAPKENKDEIEDEVPETVRESLDIQYVETMDEVLKISLEKSPFQVKKKTVKKAKKT